jgi:cytidylate kinase
MDEDLAKYQAGNLMQPPVSLIVTGPPASGKTTVRSAIRAIFSDRFPDYAEWGVDDVLRQMHLDGELNGVAEVDENGALLLSPGSSAVSVALDRLLDRRLESPHPALIEVPVDDRWFSSFLSSGLAEQSMVIHLRAPLSVRVTRNSNRTRARISTEGLLAMPAEFSVNVAQRMASCVQCLLTLDSTLPERAMQEVGSHCAAIYLSSYHDWSEKSS